MALIRPRQSDMTVFLRMLYLRTEQDLLKELNRLRENGFVEYGTYASLMRVQAILQEMQDESFQYVPQAINKVFNETNKRLGYKAAEALSVPQTAIAEQLAGNLLGNINEAAEMAYRTSERIMQIGRLHPDAFRNPTIEASLFREAGGVGQTAVEKALKTFNTQNVTSFVDKSGREWGLTEYCTMATRTVSKQAVVAAELTADDWDLWKISPNGTTCALCAAYEGRVYSKSGTNPDYPPLSAAFGKIDAAAGDDLSNTYLNIHPNCLHSLVKYTTAGRTEKEIQRDKDFSSFEKRPANVDYRTKRQIKEYREKEKTRAEFLETRRQWNEYRERLGDKIPSLETFEKHKKANDEKYKEWMKAYRAKGAELRKEHPELFPKKTAPEPIIPPAPKPFVSSFTPAESIADAEKYAERFVDKNAFGAIGVSYKGVDLEVANKVNKTIGDFYDEFDVGKFGGIMAPAGNMKLGKLISGATAGYSPVRNSFLLNRGSLKNVRTATEALAKEKSVIAKFLAHPEQYDTDRMSKRVLNVLMNSRQSGRGTVPDTIEEVISHELGHALEKPLRGVANYDLLKSRMAEYAPRISGYATESFSEYVAESFASWRKGENLVDPEMIKAFESLKRKRP